MLVALAPRTNSSRKFRACNSLEKVNRSGWNSEIHSVREGRREKAAMKLHLFFKLKVNKVEGNDEIRTNFNSGEASFTFGVDLYDVETLTTESHAQDSLSDKLVGLVFSNGVSVEHSIHLAYVETIRHAKRFIRIENQYFIGGYSSLGRRINIVGCRNLIPAEIAFKVVNRIEAREPFAVYNFLVPESRP
ncbi:hypothetical protein NE237_012667 [Protea cynaroides]|uniref:Uncharacterized protein n=1 Tax=Protea cynaroides TaxID=273540 RepID=A0A9Q0H2C8_9MAGN|nr:hypothetical protein NE237_012667 [Protea cynaroides]